SGRFKKHLITVHPVDPAGKISITLDLEEFAGLPPLSEPLSNIDQVALKFREWILAQAAAGKDIVVKAGDHDGNQMVFTFGPAGGIFRVHYASPAASTTAPAKQPSTTFSFKIDLAMVRSADRFCVYDTLTPRKFVSCNKSTSGVDLTLNVGGSMGADGNSKFTVGLMTSLWPKADAGGLKLRMNLAPAAFIFLMRQPETHAAIENGILMLRSGKSVYRFEAATGRLIEGTFDAGSGLVEFFVRPHAVERELEALEKLDSGPDAFDPQAPVVSTAVFIADELAQFRFASAAAGSLEKRAAAAMVKLFSRDALAPLNACRGWTHSASDFSIPDDPHFSSGNNLVGQMALSTGIPFFDGLFDRGSWPWVLAREQLLIYAGKTQDLGPELNRILNSGKMGPVGGLLTSMLLKQINPESAAQVAAKLLPDVNIAGFDKDVAVLTQGNSASAQVIRRLADALRHLPKEDVEAMADSLAPEYGRILRSFVKSLKSRPEAIEDALPYALDEIWPDVLRAMVQSALQAQAPRA